MRESEHLIKKEMSQCIATGISGICLSIARRWSEVCFLDLDYNYKRFLRDVKEMPPTLLVTLSSLS